MSDSPQKTYSTISLILSFFVIISIAAAGFVFWKNTQTKNEIKEQKTSIERQDQQIKRILENEQIGAKTNAQDILARAESHRIEWSTIAQKILSDLENEEIKFTTLNSGENKYISITGKARSLKSIARLIAKIRQNQNFEKPFVANLSQGSSLDLPFQFNLTFYYIEQ